MAKSELKRRVSARRTKTSESGQTPERDLSDRVAQLEPPQKMIGQVPWQPRTAEAQWGTGVMNRMSDRGIELANYVDQNLGAGRYFILLLLDHADSLVLRSDLQEDGQRVALKNGIRSISKMGRHFIDPHTRELARHIERRLDQGTSYLLLTVNPRCGVLPVALESNLSMQEQARLLGIAGDRAAEEGSWVPSATRRPAPAAGVYDSEPWYWGSTRSRPIPARPRRLP